MLRPVSSLKNMTINQCAPGCGLGRPGKGAVARRSRGKIDAAAVSTARSMAAAHSGTVAVPWQQQRNGGSAVAAARRLRRWRQRQRHWQQHNSAMSALAAARQRDIGCLLGCALVWSHVKDWLLV